MSSWLPPPRGTQDLAIPPALEAVQHRLHAAAEPLGLSNDALRTAYRRSAEHDDLTAATADLLEHAISCVQRLGGLDRLWLLLAVTHGQYPLPDEVQRLRRRLELDDGLAGSRFLLSSAQSPVSDFSPMTATIVRDQVVVDTGHTAGWDLNTGIQRVVREVLRRWAPERPVLPVAWTRPQSCARTLTAAELHRAARWGVQLDAEATIAKPASGGSLQLVFPWRTTYLLAEVPLEPERLRRLSALARYSGSRVVVVGYDLIPITNAATVGPGLASSFAQYLSTVKHSAKVVAISETAAAEFRGFTRAFSAQGLRLPEVVTCQLPAEPPPAGGSGADKQAVVTVDARMVLSVGSIEVRKNHLALLQAAELLWREGLAFRLQLIGKVSLESADVVDRIAELRDAGRDLELRSDVSDTELRLAYEAARLSVFVSTHEGYGLPVAESIACGTPVVTTRYGSTAEAARGGGAVLVDPHDDDAIADAMRTLLTRDDLHGELVQQCRTRAPRTWDDYAAELWDHVLPPPREIA